MNKWKYVFSQLLDFLVKDGESQYQIFHLLESFSSNDARAVSNRESCKELVLATQAHTSKTFHMDFSKVATRSSLSKANNNRGWRIFEEFFYRVMTEAQKCRAVEIFQLGGKKYAFDSSTIDLCLSVIG